MSTNGFIALKHDSKMYGTYNHSDSYPSWLGVRMVEFIQEADLDTLGDKVANLTLVDEGESPTPEQLADLKARGYWQNVSSGADWYAALRNAQGDLGKYIEAGYLPEFDATEALASSNIFIEYGYVIDLDTRELRVYENGDDGKHMVKLAELTFNEILAPGFDGQGYMNKIENP